MSILIRSDGTRFVMQAYRETFPAKKKQQVVQEICLLAEQHGQYAHLYHDDKEKYAAVFSTDPGFLLGESVWHYFDKPENLIYCEALPDSAKLVVVVVQNSKIHCDKKIIASNLQSELLPLMTGDIKYRIITSGNVPLRKAESFGTFRFPKALIESFEMLDEPLLPSLPALKTFELQPLPLVLRAEHLNFGFSTTTIIALVLVFVIGAWWVLKPNDKAVSMHRSALAQVSNSYAPYYQALSSPAPGHILRELVNVATQLYALPGWRATQISYSQQEYRINLASDGGMMRYLLSWTKRHNYRFQLNERGAELTLHSGLPARPAIKKIVPSDLLVTQLVDRINQLLQYPAVRLGATERKGAAEKTRLTIDLNSVSPDLLKLISQQLYQLPVELTSVRLHLETGLMSGTIQLAVWGKGQ